MPKGKGKGRKSGGVTVPTYGSDDERTYANESAPDPTLDDFYHDEVDQFHAARDKLSLDAQRDLEPAAFSSDEEVLDIGEDDDEEIAEYRERLRQLRRHGVREKRKDSDDEEEDENEGLPDEKAWGQKKNKYYGGDVDDDDDIDFSGSEPDAAILEEEEALAIQKKMAAQLDEDDIGLDLFKPAKQDKKKKEKMEEDEEEKIERDLSSLSRKQKLQLLKKDSPELIELMEDYKVKMKELQERLLPLLKLIKDGTLPASRGADYIKTKVQLCMNYCINIHFYLMLKAKHTPVHNHPVIGRIVQYRNLLKQLEAVDTKTKDKVDDLLALVESGRLIIAPKTAESAKPGRKERKLVRGTEKTKSLEGREKRKLSALLNDSSDEEATAADGALPPGGKTWGKKSKLEGRYETTDEKDALEYYAMMKSGRGESDELGADDNDQDLEENNEMADLADGNEEEWEDDDRRAITYQMSKNKGLTPHRKKEYRNPRVKHRMKFRKANIARKGQVRQVRTEMTRYAGELSGIRAGVKSSRKFKS